MAKKNADTLWEDVRTWLSDATRTAIREAEDLTRRGRLKMEIMNLSHRIERKLTELGGLVYERFRGSSEPLSPDAAMTRLVHDIGRLEQERADKRAEYEAEKRRRRAD